MWQVSLRTESPATRRNHERLTCWNCVESKTLRINFVGAKSRAKLTDLASWSPRNETRRLTRPGRSVKGSSTSWEAWWAHPVGIGCCHNYPISKRVGVDTIAFTWELSKISFSAVYIKSPGTYIEYERKVLSLNHRKTKMKNDHGQGLLHRDLGVKRSSDRDYSYLCHSQQTTCSHTDRNQKSDNDKKLQPYDKQSNVQISKHTFLADNIYMLIKFQCMAVAQNDVFFPAFFDCRIGLLHDQIWGTKPVISSCSQKPSNMKWVTNTICVEMLVRCIWLLTHTWYVCVCASCTTSLSFQCRSLTLHLMNVEVKLETCVDSMFLQQIRCLPTAIFLHICRCLRSFFFTCEASYLATSSATFSCAYVQESLYPFPAS